MSQRPFTSIISDSPRIRFYRGEHHAGYLFVRRAGHYAIAADDGAGLRPAAGGPVERRFLSPAQRLLLSCAAAGAAVSERIRHRGSVGAELAAAGLHRGVHRGGRGPGRGGGPAVCPGPGPAGGHRPGHLPGQPGNHGHSPGQRPGRGGGADFRLPGDLGVRAGVQRAGGGGADGLQRGKKPVLAGRAAPHFPEPPDPGRSGGLCGGAAAADGAVGVRPAADPALRL